MENYVKLMAFEEIVHANLIPYASDTDAEAFLRIRGKKVVLQKEQPVFVNVHNHEVATAVLQHLAADFRADAACAAGNEHAFAVYVVGHSAHVGFYGVAEKQVFD